MEATVKPSGILCSRTAKKIRKPRGTEMMNAEAMETPSKNVWMESPTSAENPTPGAIITSPCTSSPKWKWGATVCSKK
jgi:hypothetical protein